MLAPSLFTKEATKNSSEYDVMIVTIFDFKLQELFPEQSSLSVQQAES
jgi:hypothetical protein